MSEQAGMSGELIYEHAVQISQVTEYGVALTGGCGGRGGAGPAGERASTIR
jgi:hypothetical protein